MAHFEKFEAEINIFEYFSFLSSILSMTKKTRLIIWFSSIIAQSRDQIVNFSAYLKRSYEDEHDGIL